MTSITPVSAARGLSTMSELGSTEFREWIKKTLCSGAVYLGPAHVVEERGQWFVSASTNDAHFLLHGMDGKVRAFLNVCRHREAQILVPTGEGLEGRSGKLTSSQLVCSAHNWAYNSDGSHELSPALGFRREPCLGLHEVPIENIGGMYWTGTMEERAQVKRILALPLMEKYEISAFIPSHYVLHEIWVSTDTFNPETGMEVYGEVDHVDDPAVHGSTLMQFVRPSGLEINCVEGVPGNVQVVPFLEKCDHTLISQEWFMYRDMVLEHTKGTTPPFGAVWIAHYGDGTTVEYFPKALVVSRFAPNLEGNGTRNVVEFYFSDEVLGFYSELAEWFVRAYKKLAGEDAILCARMDRGRAHLRNFGKGNEVSGPTHPLEEGAVSHYFRWLHDAWSRRLKVK